MILTNMSCNPDSGEAEFPHKVVLSLVSRPPKLFGGRIIGKMISKNNAVYSVLRAAWAEYGSVCMTDLEGGIMDFDFESAKDRNRVMDKSLWSVHGHCLSLKACQKNIVLARLTSGQSRYGCKCMD